MHQLIVIWFSWVKGGGYLGIFLLMALESTFLPVPAELVIPPAAYWAAQGQLSLFGVILSGTLGGLFGALLMYGFFAWTGERFINLFERWHLLKREHLGSIESWVNDFGAGGVFFARLLPVFRHLVSIPAGMFKLRLRNFVIATFFGAGTWCIVLAFWGQKILGRHPELLNSPETMLKAVHKEMFGFMALILGVAALYAFVIFYQRRHKKRRTSLNSERNAGPL